MALDLLQTLTSNPASSTTAASSQAATHGAAGHAKKGGFWHELVAQVAAAAGMSPSLAVSVAKQESGLNPGALNPLSGAIGIMQLMPHTAAELGVNPHDAIANITGGVRYLRDQLVHFGDAAKAVAAYNWGPAHVTAAVERWGSEWLQHAPAETQRYVAAILQVPGAAGFSSWAAATPATPSSTMAMAAAPQGVSPALAAEAASLRSALHAYQIAELME